MHQPRPEKRPPIRQINNLLAEAYRLATATGDRTLVKHIDMAWIRAEDHCADHEKAQAECVA